MSSKDRRAADARRGCAVPDLGAFTPERAPVAACTACAGTGWVIRDLPTHDPAFGKPVRCPRCSARNLAAACGLDERERSLTVAAVNGDEPEDRLLRGLAADCIARPHGWLTLWGGYGNAKSLFAQIVVAELVRAGIEARFARALDVEQAFFSDVKQDTNHLPRFRDVPVLVLDEAEKVNYRSDWTRNHWQALLDARYRAALAEKALTLFTLNADPDGAAVPGDVLSRMNDGRFSRPLFSGAPPAYTVVKWGERVIPPIIHLGGTDARPYIKPTFIEAGGRP